MSTADDAFTPLFVGGWLLFFLSALFSCAVDKVQDEHRDRDSAERLDAERKDDAEN